jgi:hypothetical protein
MPEKEERNFPENDEIVPDDTEYVIPEDEDRIVADDEEQIVPDEEEEATPGKKHRRFGWKPVLLAVVAFVIVGSLVQVLLRDGDFGGAISNTGEKEKGPQKGDSQTIKKPGKRKTVKLHGNAIPREAGAIVVADPGLVAPGGKAGVQGAGFDPKARVDLLLKGEKGAKRGKNVGTVTANRKGSFNANFKVPDSGSSKSTTLVAQQRGGDKVAKAELIAGQGIGSVKTNKMSGKPGDTVSLSARGFTPEEAIKVYWGRIKGEPVTTLQADSSGSVSRESVRVGVAPTGTSTLVLVGRKSKTTATTPFEMQGLYPTLGSKPYALKSGELLTLSAKGFAPDEAVLIYINSSAGVPAFKTETDSRGNVGGVTFKVPFGLKGEQSLTAIGEETRAVVRAGFSVLPYTPTAEPSTFGGKPGTSLSFYVSGFAPGEKVTVHAGSPGGDQKKISTFTVNDKGAAKAAGNYTLTEEDANGVSFKLVGHRSKSTAQAGVNSSEQGGEGEAARP